MPVTIDIAELHPAQDRGVATDLLALQRAAYAVEAALIGDDRIPTLTETLDELQEAGLRWRGVLVDGRPVAAVAWVDDDEERDIHRLVVHPDHARRGLGWALVGDLLDDAGERGVVVSTAEANAPARRLYERAGFALESTVEVAPGLRLTAYRLRR